MTVLSCNRVWAITYYYLNLIVNDKVRVVLIVFWPILTVTLFGFMARWVSSDSHLLLGMLMATAAWGLLRRTAFDTSMRIYDDASGKTIINLFASPLTIYEYVAGIVAAGIIITLFTVLCNLCAVLLMFHVNLIADLRVLLFVPNLFITGFALGIFAAAFIIYHGYRSIFISEILAWIFAPVSGAFYPIEVLPMPLKFLAQLLPISYTMHAIRLFAQTGSICWSLFFKGLALSTSYLIIAFLFFLFQFIRSKDKGLLRLMD